MALEASHLRFALDLKDRYDVSDLKRYLAGSIYPDSRYVTGVDRLATHPPEFREWNIGNIDDFKKGWLVHLLADDIQRDVIRELLPQVYEGKHGQGSEVWVKQSAIKVLQDVDDARRFDIKKYLPYLKHVETPNDEDETAMRRYQNIFTKMYADPEKVDIKSCYEMWRELGVDDDLAMQIKTKAEEYSRDPKTVEAVAKIYSEMLRRV